MLRKRFSKRRPGDHRGESFVRLALQGRILEECFGLSRMKMRLTCPNNLRAHLCALAATFHYVPCAIWQRNISQN
jgi:hypothetical protein